MHVYTVILNYDIYDMMPYDKGLDFISYETMPIFMKSFEMLRVVTIEPGGCPGPPVEPVNLLNTLS